MKSTYGRGDGVKNCVGQSLDIVRPTAHSMRRGRTLDPDTAKKVKRRLGK